MPAGRRETLGAACFEGHAITRQLQPCTAPRSPPLPSRLRPFSLSPQRHSPLELEIVLAQALITSPPIAFPLILLYNLAISETVNFLLPSPDALETPRRKPMTVPSPGPESHKKPATPRICSIPVRFESCRMPKSIELPSNFLVEEKVLQAPIIRERFLVVCPSIIQSDIMAVPSKSATASELLELGGCFVVT